MEMPPKGNPFGKFIPARYVLAILGCVGMSIIYGLKVNLSVAMVGMLNHTALNSHEDTGTHTAVVESDCGGITTNNTSAVVEDGPFLWSAGLQGIILSCYFWGYMIGQIPGGRVAELFSAKWVMYFSVFINVLCTLLTPISAWQHPAALVVMRVGEGIGGGVTFPAMHVLLSKWAPPEERSVMAALTYAGCSLGTVLSMLMSGLLTSFWGWESVFYVMGSLSAIWCLLWIILVSDSPEQQRFISSEERKLIQNSLGTKEVDNSIKKRSLPYKAVLKSLPFWAIMVAHVCSNFGWYMLLIELPFYMKQVLKLNMSQNTAATAIPFFTLWLCCIGLSKLLDNLKSKGKITTTTARKIATMCASLIPMLCLLALCFVGCDRTATIVLMGVAVTFKGGMFCGFLSNHIDIAPNFAGTLVAITNTVASTAGIVVPIFVGYVTDGDHTLGAWRKVFIVTIALYVVEIVFYSWFGSGEEQWWNKSDTKDDPEVTPMNETQLKES